jgi:hypothetical protein
VAKDEYISSKTQSWTTAATFPSGVKAIWLLTVIQTCGCAAAGVADANPSANTSAATRQVPNPSPKNPSFLTPGAPA